MDSYIAGLLDELDRMTRSGKAERAAAVRAELAKHGFAVTDDVLPDEVETAEATPVVERAVSRRRR